MEIEDLIEQLDPAMIMGPGFLPTLRQYLAHVEAQADAARDATRLKAAGVDVDVSKGFLLAVYDQRNMQVRPEVKWYSPNAKLGTRTGSARRTLKRGICVHHTAVTGGFGADKALVQQYLKRGEPDFDPSRWLVPPKGKYSIEDWARAEALAHRFRGDPPRRYNEGVPYHAISGANSVLYLNLPFEWVTWHGNGANTDFLGYAWDANSAKEKPKADDLIADLRYLVELARSEGHPIEELTAHCAWTNKRLDPGREFISTVMAPAAEELGLRIDWVFKANAKGAISLGEVAGRS